MTKFRPPLLDNPLFTRERRSRFRHGRAFLLLGGYALLCVAMFLFYSPRPQQLSGRVDDFALWGRTVFTAMLGLQSSAWLLLAPALTASSITRERERGLLEGLQLTPLTAWQILLGKLFSSLAFAALLWLSGFPLWALCLLLGGVAPHEVAAAFCLQLGTALCGASLGLLCSAWSHRTATALRISLGVALFCLIGGILAPLLAAAPFLKTLPRWPLWLLAQSCPTLTGISITNPDIATLLGRVTAQTWPAAASQLAVLLGAAPPWLIGAALQFSLGLFALCGAYWPLRRPFGTKPRRAAKVRRAPKVAHTGPMRDLAPHSLTTFANPVLTREVRAKMRMQQPPLPIVISEAALGLLVAVAYLTTFYWTIFDPLSLGLSRLLGTAQPEFPIRETVWRVVPWVLLLVGMPACALMGAASVAREVENGSWEALRLSLLRPHELLLGKLGGAVWALCVFSLPAWPLLLPGVRGLSATPALRDLHNVQNGVPLTFACATLLLLSATALGTVAWGVLVSCLNRQISSAAGWSIGSLVLLLAGVAGQGKHAAQLAAWHPFFALFHLQHRYDAVQDEGLNIVWPCVLLWWGIAVICSAAAWWLLRRKMTERE